MLCPTCGAPNADDARTCASCGSELPVSERTVRAERGVPSHLDSNGNGVPDVLETPTRLMGAAEPTTVAHAEPATVMETPNTEPDATRIAPLDAPHPSSRLAPAPAPAPAPASKSTGGRRFVIALLAIALLVGAGAGISYWRSYQAEREAAEQALIEQQEQERQAAEDARLLEEKRRPHAVILPISAAGLDSSGTRIPVLCTGTDFEGNAVETSAYLEADGSGLSLPKGSYEVVILASPIAGDGTLYEVPGAFAFEIPETQAAGSEFLAPGTLVLTPYDAGSVPADVLDSAVSHALADPAMSEEAVRALADKVGAASSQAEHDAAIAEAQNKGRVVLSGTVRVVNGRELCEMHNIDIETLFGDQAAREEQTTYIIVMLDEETSLECMSGDGTGLRTDTATMISLTKQDPVWWREHEGERVLIAISPTETWWPSDASLPVGEPRTPHVQVIE